MVKYIIKFNKSTNTLSPVLPKKAIPNRQWQGTRDLGMRWCCISSDKKNPGFGVYNNDLLNKI